MIEKPWRGDRIQAFLCVMLVAAAGTAQATQANSGDQAARMAFLDVLQSVDRNWFGVPYQDINAVDLQGILHLDIKSQPSKPGQTDAPKGGMASLSVKGTYFANGDFRTELGGDFGNLIYTRVGKRGFLYSVEQNAYTTKIDSPPVDAPLSYMGWFREVLNDIQAVYVNGKTFKRSMGKRETIGPRTFQTFTLASATGAYDPKKREQSVGESLGFWKRGRLDVTYDVATKLPQSLFFSNEAQGVRARMDFTYSSDGKLQAIQMDNQSRGTLAPASLNVTYGNDGLMNHVAGTLKGSNQDIAFSMNLKWSKGKKVSTILSVPPPGAIKRGGDEMMAFLAVGFAGKMLDLQRKGLNLRSVTPGNP